MVLGIDDCVPWVADIVLELTGVDIAEPFRGYRTRFGAARIMRLYGGGGLAEAALQRATELGLQRAARPYRGLLVGVVASREGAALALFHQGAWVSRTAMGVGVLPAHAAVLAWRLPWASK